ncbi:Hypothetical protein CAP_4115 [Chondromyces apiculatus DSM 436]|uniref:Uncharacterized protein n=1 Tax=Chondromyces apiculatus DSM 436 TaxID=1192034 RepID=A0A017TID2_9BACT|nr:Hypothetical protein CAP_4115 [Chondromyces apiculatus DSM 436]
MDGGAHGRKTRLVRCRPDASPVFARARAPGKPALPERGSAILPP